MKNFKKNWFRHLLQWGTLAAIIIVLTKVLGNESADPEAYCPVGLLPCWRDSNSRILPCGRFNGLQYDLNPNYDGCCSGNRCSFVQ